MGPTDGAATDGGVSEAEKLRTKTKYTRDPKAYDRWKTLVPYLYDFFTSHKMFWPSLSCRWGKVQSTEKYFTKQRFYFSEQTDSTSPNKLIVGIWDVVKPRVASAESLSNFQENCKSPFLHVRKTIYHPGEINRLRECLSHPDWVATHTDSQLTYVWNIQTQKDRKAKDPSQEPNMPDIILKGHMDYAEYALASGREPGVACFASGGKDKLVCLWALDDLITSLSQTGGVGRTSVNSGGLGSVGTQELDPRTTFRGHTDVIEEVAFRPNSSHEIVSVGDDKSMRFWDERAGTSSVIVVENAHDSDVQCVDWSPIEGNYILTGAADATVKVFDQRKLSSGGSCSRKDQELLCLTHHKEPLLHVEWSPHEAGIFGSAGEDGMLNIWNLAKNESKSSDVPPQLLFQHVGHRSQILDFQWNPEDKWTIMSLSNDQADGDDGSDVNEWDITGGTMQIWRMNDMIYRPEKEVLEELEQQRNKLFK